MAGPAARAAAANEDLLAAHSETAAPPTTYASK